MTRLNAVSVVSYQQSLLSQRDKHCSVCTCTYIQFYVNTLRIWFFELLETMTPFRFTTLRIFALLKVKNYLTKLLASYKKRSKYVKHNSYQKIQSDHLHASIDLSQLFYVSHSQSRIDNCFGIRI